MTDRIIAANGLIVEGLPASIAGSVTQSLEHSDAALDAWLALREARAEGWLPDGALLLRATVGGAPQLMRLAAPGARLEPLTFHVRPIVAAQLAPAAGFSFLLRRDAATQLYDYRLIDRSVRRIGDATAEHRDPLWSRDARRLAFSSNMRNGIDQDLYVATPGGRDAPRLLAVAAMVDGRRRAWQALAWSADDSRLLLRQYVPDQSSPSRESARLFVADVGTGALTAIAVDDGSRKAAPLSIADAGWASDGQRLLLLAALDDEPTRLHELDPATGALRSPGAALPWNAEQMQISADARRVALRFNAAGLSAIRVLDLTSGAQAEPPGLPQGIVTAMHFDADGTRLALSLEDAQQPAAVWVWDLRSQQLLRWTESPAAASVSASARGTSVRAQRLQLPGWDRAGRRTRDLSAWLLRRASAGKSPVLIDLHRGAGAVYRPGFDAGLQHLASALDIAVLLPNLPFEDQDSMVRDIGSLLVWISAQRGLDSQRITIMGRGSAAGVAVAALAQYGDRLRGAIHDEGNGLVLSNAMSALLHRPILMLHGFESGGAEPAAGGLPDAGQQLAARLRGSRAEVWRVVRTEAATGVGGGTTSARALRIKAIAAFLRHCNA